MQNNNLTHLGSRSTEYIDKYDPSLLEKIDRLDRRKEYSWPIFGEDVWTAFEFTFLLLSGKPSNHILRIHTSAHSRYIFESKSLKLYLNSFSNTTFKDFDTVIGLITKDLSNLAGLPVKVYNISENFSSPEDVYSGFRCIDELEVEVKDYDYKPLLLKVKPLDSFQVKQQRIYSDLLRSRCEQTGQPDSGRVIINLVANKMMVDEKAFLQYIISFRNKQQFHEPICEQIYNDLFELLNPIKLVVICQYTRRGGIDINPVRSNEEIFTSMPLPKLIQQ